MPRNNATGDRRDFPRTLRADPRLNLTARLAWLMVTLAYHSGYASMSPQRLAAELQSTLPAVRRTRQKLVAFGLFGPPERWRYGRILRPDEDAKAYWHRVRADPRLDLTTRCAWALTDLTRRGAVPIAMTMIAAALGTTEKRASQAVGRTRALDLFTVTEGGGRGRLNIYSRHRDAASLAQYFELQQEVSYGDDDGQDIEDIEYYRRHFPQTAAVAGF